MDQVERGGDNGSTALLRLSPALYEEFWLTIPGFTAFVGRAGSINAALTGLVLVWILRGQSLSVSLSKW